MTEGMGRRRHLPPGERKASLNGCVATARGMVAASLREFSDRLEPGFDPSPVVSELAEALSDSHKRADDCASRFVTRHRDYLDSAAASELVACETAYEGLVRRVAEHLAINSTFRKTDARLPTAETCEAILEQAARTWPDFQSDLSAILRVDREKAVSVGPTSVGDKPGAPLILIVGHHCPSLPV